jgi:S1-C subfamily serine protease
MSLDKMEVKPEFTGADKTKVKNEEKKEEKKGYGKVYTGTIPDFSENVNGYKISGVNPDSPAEKAGLTGGDIIIKFGDREIKSITDYTYALGDHKPGDELEVIVMRGTEKITMKIVLGTKK